MPGTPLSSPDRDEIHAALIEDRDLPVGRDRPPGRSSPDHGHPRGRPPTAAAAATGPRPRSDAPRRCRRRPRERLLAEPGELRARVQPSCKLGRSPVAIVLDLAADDVAGRACVETIYHRRLRRRPRRHRPRVPADAPTPPTLPHQPATPATVRRCRTSCAAPPRSTTAPSPATGKPTRSSAPTTASSMIWLSERVTRYSIPITMPNGYTADDVLAGLVEASTRSPHTCCGRSPSTRDRSGPTGRPSPPPTTSTAGSATRTRRGNAARSRTSTASGDGGSPAAPTSPASPSRRRPRRRDHQRATPPQPRLPSPTASVIPPISPRRSSLLDAVDASLGSARPRRCTPHAPRPRCRSRMSRATHGRGALG